jgi:hypothetical protein
MTMDLSKSQWHSYTTDENIFATAKMFYGKYLFKAEVEIPGAFYVRYAKGKTFDKFVEMMDVNRLRRKEMLNDSIGVFRYWKDKGNTLDNAVDRHLYDTYTFIASKKGIGKHKIKQNTLHFYVTTPTELKEFLDLMQWPIHATINKIFMPADTASMNQLEQEVIFVKREPLMPYRIYVSSERFDVQTKTNILNYLNNFPDDIMLTKSLARGLADPRFLWLSGYLNVKDLSTLTFLKMISPKFVKKIYKLEKAANK